MGVSDKAAHAKPAVDIVLVMFQVGPIIAGRMDGLSCDKELPAGSGRDLPRGAD